MRLKIGYRRRWRGKRPDRAFDRLNRYMLRDIGYERIDDDFTLGRSRLLRRTD